MDVGLPNNNGEHCHAAVDVAAAVWLPGQAAPQGTHTVRCVLIYSPTRDFLAGKAAAVAASSHTPPPPHRWSLTPMVAHAASTLGLWNATLPAVAPATMSTTPGMSRRCGALQHSTSATGAHRIQRHVVAENSGRPQQWWLAHDRVQPPLSLLGKDPSARLSRGAPAQPVRMPPLFPLARV